MIWHFDFFPYKCPCYQIWPWHKIGQGHLRVIIWTNYDGPESPMLHTKFRGNRPSGSGEEDFEEVLTSSWPWPLHGHVTWTPRTNFCSPIPLRLHMKFGFNRSSGSGGEDVWKCWQTTHTHTAWPPYKLTKWAYGSGELKTRRKKKIKQKISL